jgi:transposase
MSKRNRVRAGGRVTHQRRYDRTCGIDTDRDFLVAAFYNSAAPYTLVEEFPQTAAGIAALIEKIKATDTQLTVIESTGQYHLDAYRRLAAAGVNILVVNPLTIKALLRVEGKSDKRDAATLAWLGATFDLRPSNMPDGLQQELRYQFKIYDEALQARVRLGNRLNAHLVSNGCRLCQVVGRRGDLRDTLIRLFLEGKSPEQIASAHPKPKFRPAILEATTGASLTQAGRDYALWLFQQYLKDCEDERHQLQVILGQFDLVKSYVFWAASVPGTTPELLIRLVAECGGNFTERYMSAERFCSALGTAPRSEVSGGKLLKVADTHGNARMVTALTAHYKAYMVHMKGTGPLNEWLAGYRARTSYSRTLLALSHKITEAWWHCTKLKRSYDEYKAFGVPRPALMPLPTRVGTVNADTGEIFDEGTPLALDVPDIHDFMQAAQTHSAMSERWHYTHDGD